MAQEFLYAPREGYQFIHATYVKDDYNDALVANIKSMETNESMLEIIKNPKLPVWVTKPCYRNYNSKREFSPENELDRYVTTFRNLPETLSKALGYHRIFPMYQLMKSPYVYGAKIGPDNIMKSEYYTLTEGLLPVLNYGGLDIETDVTGSRRINLMTYADKKRHTAYCCVLKDFLKDGETIDVLKKRWHDRYKQFVKQLKPSVRERLNKTPFTVRFRICETEEELIRACFGVIHACKPDFCIIWNISFDLPYIENRIIELGLNPADIICHPEVPMQYRYYYFQYDKSFTQHITDKWHWVYCTGYTQFIDGMPLYARNRKAESKESSYGLDAISGKVLGTGKIEFEGNATHYIMQTERFVDYAVYNTFDGILLVLMEEENEDIDTMLILSKTSPLDVYSKQTVRLTNEFYRYCRDRNCVCASVQGSIRGENDWMIVKLGGAVLDVSKSRGTGLNLPGLGQTELQMYVADLDVKSEYPSLDQALNIAKETKLATVITITNMPGGDGWIPTKVECDNYAKMHPKDPYAPYHVDYYLNIVEDYFANIATPEENAEYICHKYYGLPTYMELADLVANLMDNEQASNIGAI